MKKTKRILLGLASSGGGTCILVYRNNIYRCSKYDFTENFFGDFDGRRYDTYQTASGRFGN